MSLRRLGGFISSNYNPYASNITTGVNTAQYQGVFNPQDEAIAITQQQWVKDPSFNQTTLLLQADRSANGAQNNTFLDSSSNAFTITRNGNTTQGTFTPFSQTGYWSAYFNGTSGLQTPASSITSIIGTNGLTTSSTFTCEAWIYLTQYSSSEAPIFGDMAPSAGTRNFSLLVNSTGKLAFSWYLSPNTYTATGNTTISTNTWTNVAVTISGTAIYLFVNGVLQTLTGTTTNSGASSTTGYIGLGEWNAGASNLGLFGFISNLRVIKTAYYTLSYTPSTIPLTAIANTGLLICQSNRFVDNSTNAFTITANGSPSVQAFSPFGPQYQYDPLVTGGSGYFDGSASYLSVPTNTALSISGNVDAAIEFWIYPTAASSACIVNKSGVSGTSYSNYIVLTNSNNSISFQVGNSGAPGSNQNTLNTSAGTITLNAWNHVVCTKNYVGGGTVNYYRVLINGVLSAYNSQNNPSDGTPTAFTIGHQPSATGDYFPGYITGVRVFNTSIPAAYQTSSITPGAVIYTVPTAPASPSTSSICTNFTNAGIYDGTLKNDLQTVGNAQVSTAVVKYGSGSMYFDGSGDGLTLANNPLLQLGSSDFTVEFWAYRVGTNAMTWVFLDGNSSNYNGFRLDTDTSGNIFLLMSANGSTWTVNTSGTAVLPTSTWTHIAAVRLGTSVKLYVNGIQQISSTFSGSVYAGTVHYVGTNYGATQVVNGYVDDVRLTTGIARYTANFIPPSVALPRQ